mgnify:CR=1 FL=1
MNSAELYWRVKKVLSSCKTPKQTEVAIRYAVLASRKVSADWHSDLLGLVATARHEAFNFVHDDRFV